ncbi:hypothetical protein ASU33_19635 [Solirubrum puertoriconensis]|uniref:Gliding motility-associated protein GldM N-terminal domain-containing protein n=2 Tax=Solirubrum puertoriconensis TaxID=1751427 RepID=A0A9X0L5S1_SOLP1|nr:hypothetical protein ASU33_19635 [Solirubrum puertoriconensis]
MTFTRSFIQAGLIKRLACAALLLPLAAGSFSCQGPSADAAALLRLHQLEGALLNSSDNLFKANAERLQGMEAQARAAGRPADMAILAQAQALRDSTRALTSYLRAVRERLNQHTRNEDPLARLATHGAAGEFMQASPGPADSLQHQLRRYGELLQRVTPATAGAGQAGSLEPFDFGETSLAGALAALARCEAAVLLQEHKALVELSTKVTPTRLQTALRPVVSAKASSVAPGDTYQAQVSVASVKYHPGALAMTVNGKAIEVGPDGIGQVALSPPALSGGRAQQAYWEGTITVRAGARDSTFRLRVPYTVEQ